MTTSDERSAAAGEARDRDADVESLAEAIARAKGNRYVTRENQALAYSLLDDAWLSDTLTTAALNAAKVERLRASIRHHHIVGGIRNGALIDLLAILDERRALTGAEAGDGEAKPDYCPTHYLPLPCRETCGIHQQHEPCQTCGAYIAAGL